MNHAFAKFLSSFLKKYLRQDYPNFDLSSLLQLIAKECITYRSFTAEAQRLRSQVLTEAELTTSAPTTYLWKNEKLFVCLCFFLSVHLFVCAQKVAHFISCSKSEFAAVINVKFIFLLSIAKLSPAQSNSNSVGWAEIALI